MSCKIKLSKMSLTGNSPAWRPRDSGCVGLGFEAGELDFHQFDEFGVCRAELLAEDPDLTAVSGRGVGGGPEGADHSLDAVADVVEERFAAGADGVVAEDFRSV